MNCWSNTNFLIKNKAFSFIFVIFFVILAGSLFFSVKTVNAATYYVSTSGTDDVSHGTSAGAGAWLTLDYALTGSRVAKGDIINIEAGTYSNFYGANTRIEPTINTATGSGPVIIQASPAEAVVTIDMPTNTSGAYSFFYFNPSKWGEFTFKNINFTNSNATSAIYFWVYGHNLTLEDCQIIANPTVSRVLVNISTDTDDTNLTVRRSTFINGPSGNSHIFRNVSKVGANINIESSLFYDQTYYIFSLEARTNVTVTNNTFMTSYAKFYISAGSSGSIYHVKNNIFYADTTSDYRPFVILDAIITEIIANPEYWDVTNNIWYRASAYQSFIGGINHMEQVDSTNHFINPQFTNINTDDYTIQNGSYICGHGLQSSLPVAGDVSGTAWTGNDIGAYRCPSASTGVTLQDKVAFVGDSIMGQGRAVTYFNEQTGISYVAPADAAISGSEMQKIFAHIDTVMINSSPDTVFLSIGINNLALQSPNLATNQEYADYILETLQKIEDWGATPIWLGIGTLNGYGGLPDTPIPLINAAVEAGCVSHGWECDAYYDQMLLNPTWQSATPNGYYDTAANVHPNNAGYELIGAFAEYLYFNNHTMGTDEIDIGAGARIYADGKFRDNGSVSGLTADMTVTPEGGSFVSGDYSYWLDVEINSWFTSGTYNKQWTASSTVATTTVYTIGDLAPEKYYQFKLDGVVSTTDISGDTCTDGLCLTDASGNLVFTYTGGYSEHIFALEQNVEAPTNVGVSSVTANSTTQLTIIAETAIDSDPGLSATPYWFNEISANAGGSSSVAWQSASTFVDSGLSANTQYSYQVKARDANSNESSYSTTLSKYTLAPTPTNFSATAGSTSMTLSVEALNNDSAGLSGYFFSRPGAESGWIQTNSWLNEDLNCRTSYTYTVKYRNGDGVESGETTVTQSTIACSSGGGGHFHHPSVGLGSEDQYFYYGQAREISNIGAQGINILTYVNTPLIFSISKLSEKYNFIILDLDTVSGKIKIKLPREEVYLSLGQKEKFDLNGDSIFDLQINYNHLLVNRVDLTFSQIDKNIEIPELLADGSLVKSPNSPNVYLIDGGRKRHIVDAKTFVAKGYQWTDIKDVANLDAYPLGQDLTSNSSMLNFVYAFDRDLQYGSLGEDVLQLQRFLNEQGFILTGSGSGSPGSETKYFGMLTKKSLINFQNKYKDKILQPIGLKSGSGYFGVSTRDFIKNNFGS